MIARAADFGLQVVGQVTAARRGGDGAELPIQVMLPPIRVTETFAPRQIEKRSKTWVAIDFGQNFAGWIRWKAKGPAGTEVVVRQAELRHPDGRLNTGTLREAKATDRFLLRGTADGETHEPHFTYHGFRYAEIEGPIEYLDLNSIEGRVAHSDMEPTLEFESSDEQMNWLMEACRWTVRANHYSVPTDCCQRNERRGWGMDGYNMANSASYFYDINTFLRKWHTDFCDILLEDGSVYSDSAPAWPPCMSVGWVRVIVLAPMKLYRMYGDIAIIERRWAEMKRFADYIAGRLGDDFLHSDFSKHCAEWLNIGQKDKPLPDNAMACEIFQVMGEAARLLGRPKEGERYVAAGKALAERFHKTWYEPHNGCYIGGTFFMQSNQVYPLRFGIVPDEDVNAVTERLIDEVAAARGETPFLTTGIGSTTHLLEVLSAAGRDDVAWGLIQRKEFPGWGFMRANGATSIWERWEKMEYHQMNAHNHGGLSGVGGWVVRSVAGLGEPKQGDEPEFILAPAIHLPIDHLRASWKSRWGVVAIEWRKEDRQTMVEATVPAGCRARLNVKGQAEVSLAAGRHQFTF